MNSTKTALITGGSSGIGLELARLFAQDKYRVILAADQAGKLQDAVQTLQQEFPDSSIIGIPVDLSLPEGPEQLYAEVKRQGLEVDALVNDAGFGEHGLFAETPLRKELAMIQLNIASLVHLTKLYLPAMIERGQGHILQLGSVASFSPNPLLSVYSATKAFVLSFSEAVQNELKGTGVIMTVLCPPATDTEFFAVANMENTKAATGPLATPQEVAKGGYEALMKGEARALPTFMAKMMAYQGNVLPDAVNAAANRKLMEEK